jgi:uncharacterized membrane protein
MGGVVVLLLALRKWDRWSLLGALPGAYLLKRGVTGFCDITHALGLDQPEPAGSSYGVVEKSVTINRPVGQVYATFRNFGALPALMKHLNAAEPLNQSETEWRLDVDAPLPLFREWRFEIVQELKEELIQWRSRPDSTVDFRGSLRFERHPQDRGTEVKLTVAYRPRLPFFAWAAKRRVPVTAQEIKEELMRVKQHLEAGEISRTEGQPHGEINNRARAESHSMAGTASHTNGSSPNGKGTT